MDHPKNSDKQMCELWDEFFIKVNKEGEVSFKWESMHKGTDRKQVIPVIKVAEVGKCFNKCNILRHPEVHSIQPNFVRQPEDHVVLLSGAARWRAPAHPWLRRDRESNP